MLDRLSLPYKPCEKKQVRDDDERLWTSVGKIDLRWHVWNIPVMYSETFYVVECEKPMVRLGESAIKEDFLAVKTGFYTIETARLSSEEKKQLAKKSEHHEIKQAAEAELQRVIARRERELKRDYDETGYALPVVMERPLKSVYYGVGILASAEQGGYMFREESGTQVRLRD
ncbi:MAG: hypothetical protein Q9226_003507 [Calogaya cf. arnoldii]